MDKEFIDDLKQRLRLVAMTAHPVTIGILANSNVKTMELLAEAGVLRKLSDLLREDERAMNEKAESEGRAAPNFFNEDHKAVYDSIKAAQDEIDEMFDKVLEATALSYWISEYCDCSRCNMRRQMAKAKLS